MKALIMPNLKKDNAVEYTKKIVNTLKLYGVQSLMDNRYRQTFAESPITFADFYIAIRQSDVIIAVGGDGTIIHSAKHSTEFNKPLLGINVGRLGFMAGLEMSELALLKKLVTHDYQIESRMMLRCLHYTKQRVREYFALNDVTISKGSLSRMVELEVICNDKAITSYRADGIILATPTGSTAYSLSAGGPVVEPSLNCIILTPICPHSLMARPIIFSEEKVISIKETGRNTHPIYITIDGEQGAQLDIGERLEVMKSPKVLRLININGKSFHEVLNKKFKLKVDTFQA